MKYIVEFLLIIVLVLPSLSYADNIAEGKSLTFDRKKGNCLACHMIDDGELAGNNGPPLLAMKARFPDREVLFQQIWDPTESNPYSFMPPFGKHGALTRTEINKIMDYLYTL
ncbi:MAG: sulfur oxidation c-type cytochrome SoxX [Gammaproteobacteria bacterium]|jgi:sulfur-oxidizing protein SoxX|tara:strand:+ start:345 stop:680 length:336 start_codon:yes stop_codon:yes gene_type:complete